MTCPLCQEKLVTRKTTAKRRHTAKRCPSCSFTIAYRESAAAGK